MSIKPVKCQWCSSQFMPRHDEYTYCSNRCRAAYDTERHRRENINKEQEPKIVEKIVEKVVYVKPKTAEELNWERQDREKARVKDEYMKESLRKLKKERLAEEVVEKAKEAVSARRWLMIPVIFLTLVFNFIVFTDGFDIEMFLMVNGFFGIYYVYFIFHKQLKKIVDWLDNK